MRVALIVMALSLGLPVAAAAAMPDYNVDAHCREIAAFGGGFSEMFFHGCLTQEQAAYNGLKSRWDGLPSAVRAHCDEIARFGGGGTYMILSGCVDQELSAGQQNRDFKFQR
jgi:hypothetical protein